MCKHENNSSLTRRLTCRIIIKPLKPCFMNTPSSNRPPLLLWRTPDLYNLNLEFGVILDSSPTGLQRLEKFLDTLRLYANTDESNFISIFIALSEAITNAMIHGNHGHPERNIYVSAVLKSDSISFSVEDEGNGFDEQKVSNPISEDNIPKPGGRGILIMRSLAKNMYYSKGGRKLNLLFGLIK